MRGSRFLAGVVFALGLVPVAAPAAPVDHGDLLCSREISRAGARLTQIRSRQLRKCDDAVAAGRIEGPCPDTETLRRLDHARTRVERRLAGRCGGKDRRCGTNDDVPLDAVGWADGICPNVAGGLCTNAVSDCSDIAACLVCVAETAVEQVRRLERPPEQPGDDLAARCRRRVRALAHRLLARTSRLEQRCWNAVLREQTGASCPDADTAAAVDRLRQRTVRSLCRACAAEPRACAEEPASQSGVVLAGKCPLVEVPGGANCGRSLETVADVAECVACVATYEGVCSLAAASRGIAPLADSCAPLLAGAAVADITPESGGEFFGYVRPDIRADGVALRLTARALVLAQGARKLALVTADLQGPEQSDFLSPTAKDSIVARLADRGFSHETLVFAGTHTHAGPTVYPDFLLEQVAEAVRRADDALVPAEAGWATVSLEDAADNRSIEAHLANHGFDLERGTGSTDDDPLGRLHTIAPQLSLLRIDRLGTEGASPWIAWGHFAAHPTNFVPANTTFSADWPGVAVRRLPELVGSDDFVAIVTNGAEGDLSPKFAGANQHIAADEMGIRVARAMHAAWLKAGSAMSIGLPLDTRWTKVCFCGQEVAPGKRVSPQPVYGEAFIGGAEDGPSFFNPLGTEGRRRPAEEADPVHGRKIIVGPAPYTNTPEFQALRIGDRLLLAVPGEPTVETGRRVRASALGQAPAGVTDAILVALANNYTGYYTTPEGYDMQHYEGGHTVNGLWSELLLEDVYRRLSEAIATGSAAPPPDAPPAAGGTDPGTAPTGDGGVIGTLVSGPPAVVERMKTAEVVWNGATLGRDRPVGAPFVTLDRRQSDGSWTAVDDDLGYRFVWRESDGQYRARYDVAADWPLGTYRLRVDSARYSLVTAPFAIVASDELRVRGVVAESQGGDTLLRFFAQNPPPDVATSILSRPKTPAGGTLVFSIDGVSHTAVWDAQTGTWTALVTGDVSGATVHIEPGALVDGLGNGSGAQAAADLTPGEVAPLDWPPDIPPGGGEIPPPGGGG